MLTRVSEEESILLSIHMLQLTLEMFYYYFTHTLEFFILHLCQNEKRKAFKNN